MANKQQMTEPKTAHINLNLSLNATLSVQLPLQASTEAKDKGRSSHMKGAPVAPKKPKAKKKAIIAVEKQ